MKSICLEDKITKLRNGWFEVKRMKQNGSARNYIGLLLLKNDYPYQNNYLISGFQKQYHLPEGTSIVSGKPTDPLAVFDHAGNYLFTLKFSTPIFKPSGQNASMVSIVLSIAGLIISLSGLFFFFLNYKQYVLTLRTLIFGLLLLVLRMAMIKFHFPLSIYATHLFDPTIYTDGASFWLPSLGDLLINTALLLTLCIFVNTNEAVATQRIKTPLNKFIWIFIYLLLLFSLALVVNKFFISLIENSNFSFNINSVFSLTGYSYLGLSIIAFLQLSFFLAVHKIVQEIRRQELAYSLIAIAFVISALVFTVTCQYLGYSDWIFIAKPFVIGVFVFLFRKSSLRAYNFTEIILLVFLFSIYSAHTLIKDNHEKEHHNRMVIAQKLASDEDPLTEHLFNELETKLNEDSVLAEYLVAPTKNIAAFEKRLRQDYFGGYWDKYNIKLAVFDTLCRALLKPAGPIAETNEFYDELIERKGQATTCERFYFLKNNSGKISYMAKVPISRKKYGALPFATLYAEFDMRFLSEESGFPDLLLDRTMGADRNLFNYSYAKYKNSSLISQYGKYKYSLTPLQFNQINSEFTFTKSDGYSHLCYIPNKSTVVIISRTESTLLDTVTSFSYLFSYFSLITLFALFVSQLVRGNLLQQYTFKHRIQFLLVLIVLISLVLFGSGTVWYINQQFESKNRESISDKINSAAVDLEGKLGTETNLNASLIEYAGYLLKKVSSVFFTDVNVYDLKGTLFASSQPLIFEEGLASKKMNAAAFREMAILQKTQFIHEEKIGELEYLSAYVPFKGRNGELLAYLNVPYFSKQAELQKEIAGFLVALINIYVILFALSVLMALFISNYLTRPLRLIQDKLSKVKLGSTNEPIEWNDKDEIGSLVQEYNRMITELSNSAELLAKSERETAWREMAKQVAHEIKNPLTPMRLNVQHLERMWNDKNPDMGAHLQRIAATLIEQIDTLSSIADAFSNFARMPKPNLEKINLDGILINVIALFKDSQETEILYNNLCKHEPACVFADKEQLIRIFNNLLKNALQAIPEHVVGKISIVLSVEENYYCISVEDNGMGISEEVIPKLFTPNFTTKTTGMGLGLAMVKSSVESFGGSIRFKTSEGKGSVFFVYLPKFYQDMGLR